MVQTSLDKDSISEAYADVLNDSTDTTWMVCRFEGAKIACKDKGTDFEKIKALLSDDERQFIFLRVSANGLPKFVFLIWIGQNVAAIKKAKTCFDRALVTDIIKNFSAEMTISEHEEFDEDRIKKQLFAPGATYRPSA